MRIIGADLIDQLPKFTGACGAFIPTGEISGTVCEGKAHAEVDSDERICGQVCDQPITYLRARPIVAGADQLRGVLACTAQRDCDASLALTDCARPVDRREMFEAARPHLELSRSPRFLSHHSSRFRISRSNPRSAGR